MKNLGGLLFIAFSFLSGCAGNGAISQRGAVSVSGESVKAWAAGPAVLHAYSQSRGGRVFLASAVSRTDADCARTRAPVGGAAIPVQVDTIEILTLGQDQVACLATSSPRPYELLWHSKASAPFQLAAAKLRR
jgi:hypothetical protein